MASGYPPLLRFLRPLFQDETSSRFLNSKGKPYRGDLSQFQDKPRFFADRSENSHAMLPLQEYDAKLIYNVTVVLFDYGGMDGRECKSRLSEREREIESQGYSMILVYVYTIYGEVLIDSEGVS